MEMVLVCWILSKRSFCDPSLPSDSAQAGEIGCYRLTSAKDCRSVRFDAACKPER